MDALAALWLTSIIGAAGFTATGFFLARSQMPRENAERAPSKEPVAASVRPAAPSTRPPPPPAEPAEPAEPTPKLASKAPVATSDRPKDPRREDDDDTAGAVEVLDAREKPKASSAIVPAALPASAESIELERQLDALRVELRAEVVARHTVEARAKELEARLSSMSQQVAALRARSSADAGAVRRDSMMRGASLIPGANTVDQRSRLSTRAPGLFAEIDDLKADIARLTSENESLRAAALGAPPPAHRSSGPRSDLIVPDVLKGMIERIARIDGVRAAAVVENNGLVLASSGERSEALAAFGNYIRDAASRSTRLLPLGAAEEVIVRDVHGVVFSSRVLGRPEAELALITLAFSAVPVRELRDIVGQTPGLGPDAISSR
jgi:predicted regulator of Ras-like GTPase activity (Roadblock/LC7/MglB family)